MFLHLLYNRPEVHSDGPDVHELHVLIEISDDILEEEELLIILVDLIVLLYVLLARQALVERPEVGEFVPSGEFKED